MLSRDRQMEGLFEEKLPFEHAMRSEFAHGMAAVQAEGQAGAARFAAGAGRGGKFGE